MASLPFHMTFIQLHTSFRNSLEAAWLDHHLHHQQRIVSLRTSLPPLHDTSGFIINSCSQTQPSQGSRQLSVSAIVQEGTEEEAGNCNGNSALVSSSTSSPKADNANLIDDGSVVITEDMNGPSAEVSAVKEQDVEIGTGEEGLWSIVIPTYNRLPILTQCLQALEEQVDYELGGIARYEVIVVDDGSTDGTVEFLLGRQAEAHEGDAHAGKRKPNGEISVRGGNYPELVVAGKKSFAAQQSRRFPHVKLVTQEHAGATKARNHGLKYASGAVIVFIDSDLVVTRSFLRAHGEALREAFREDGDDRAFTYGRVINTSNFKNPRSEKAKLTDYSAAFFATGNVAISRRRLMEAGKLLAPDVDGPFDAIFSEYGWEDLELGVRLKHLGARIKHAPDAVGYHWHPAFSIDQLPRLIEQEKQRGRNGVRFYQKHPTLYVRLMIQMTPFHELLWFVLTLGGLLNEKTLEPLLRQLEMKDMNQIAAALVSPVLNWHTVQAVKEESKKLKVN
ncbi:hypothetical protein R1flu_007317 [Riccia fluitans]|uniref:Glycosyltransferase 2-like domain-containing protein n=1 Tax=Riccia fluitans TaxID=41844 RepID=A0ABD1YYH3_9MARC